MARRDTVLRSTGLHSPSTQMGSPSFCAETSEDTVASSNNNPTTSNLQFIVALSVLGDSMKRSGETVRDEGAASNEHLTQGNLCPGTNETRMNEISFLAPKIHSLSSKNERDPFKKSHSRGFVE